MKRLFSILVTTMLAICAMAQLNAPVWKVSGDLNKYKYAYVIPTGGITASSGTVGGVFGNGFGVYGVTAGGATKTINPAETIKGYLMQMGYSILPSIMPEFADKTMIVAYGYTGRRKLNAFAYASEIIIQARDAQTQDLVATIQTEGCGADETDDILQAIHTALERLQYSRDPQIEMVLIKEYRTSLHFSFTNKTPYRIRTIVMILQYYLNDEMVHEQEVTITGNANPNEVIDTYIKRPKEVREKGMKIKCKIKSYR